MLKYFRDGGQNFGWRVREGSIQNPAYPIGSNPPPVPRVEPIHDYDTGGSQAITGGYVYHGTALDDSGQPLDGTYFRADYVAGRIWSFKYDGTTVTNFTERTTELGFTAGAQNLSSFAEDGFGNLYIISSSGTNGTVYQIAAVPEPATTGLIAAIGLVGALATWRYRRIVCPIRA